MADITSSRQCTACTRTSENKHFDCPPRMADGRLFTDYRPRCDINYTFNGMDSKMSMNSYAYRQFLISNANKLMSSQRASTYSAAVCGPCMEPYDQGTMLSEQSVMKCDASTCTVTGKDPRGLGLGRDYGSTEADATMRASFLQGKAQEQRKLAASANCCATGADKLDYYPLAGSMGSANARVAMPFGGAPLSGGDAF